MDAVRSSPASFVGKLIKFSDSQGATKYQQVAIIAWEKVNKEFVLEIIGPKVEKKANSVNKVVSVLDDQLWSGETNPFIGKPGKLPNPTKLRHRVSAGNLGTCYKESCCYSGNTKYRHQPTFLSKFYHVT